ncbi:Abhydrolase-3 domain-containing protein [Mycena venus]|uniref:Abhydrolase-3 domain-containing protein n=1 Tax=Mycena venus TaxID=2733690 RepID=A0A8H6YQB0_9AGAR|nr:Abhydrolase-3 domain-containing protein [Mycena venus]
MVAGWRARAVKAQAARSCVVVRDRFLESLRSGMEGLGQDGPASESISASVNRLTRKRFDPYSFLPSFHAARTKYRRRETRKRAKSSYSNEGLDQPFTLSASPAMAEYSRLSEPDPEFAPYVAQLTGTPQVYDVEERRNRFNSRFIETAKKCYAPGLPKETKYGVADHHVDVANGKILVKSLVPISEERLDATYPLMVWMHGGGWATGNVDMDDYQLRAICVELQISILNVEYRLVPEHPHPTSLNDCYTALKWAASSPELFSADLKKGFIVGGFSAGGHLATVLAHRARDDPFFNDKPLTGQLLQVPALLHPNAIPEKYKLSLLSYEQNKQAPFLPQESIVWSYNQLGGIPTDPEVSPLLYPSHKGLVPAVIQVCGLDPLRDEDLLYDSLLKDAGVKTRTATYSGVPHAFQYVFPTLKAAVKWAEDYRTGLRWLLDGAVA